MQKSGFSGNLKNQLIELKNNCYALILGKPHNEYKAHIYALFLETDLCLLPFGLIWKQIIKNGNSAKSQIIQNWTNMDLAI